MRPAGPVPGTNCSSMPRSQARRRTAGEASGFCAGTARDRDRSGGCHADARPSPSPRSAASGSPPSPAVRERGWLAAASPSLPLPACGERVGVRGWLRLRREPVAPSGRLRRHCPRRRHRAPPAREPTGRLSPGSPSIATTLPATGAGISTVALSVITSTSGSSSRITWPGATCQATISASAMPSPMSGTLTT